MLSNIAFYIFAALTVAAAIAAMTLRNLIHCALCVAAAFAGIAMIYLQLNAEFVGLAQILVYVGAVAILIVFAILLTRGTEVQSGVSVVSRSWFWGVIAAALVLAGIVTPILLSPSFNCVAKVEAAAPVQKIGEKLMTDYVLPLEGIGLLLTAALLGAVVVAMQDKKEPTNEKSIKRPESVIAGGVK